MRAFIESLPARLFRGISRPAAAFLALGICLAALAPAAQAGDLPPGEVPPYVRWKFQIDRNVLPGLDKKPACVWNGDRKEEVDRILKSGDYAEFDRITEGFVYTEANLTYNGQGDPTGPNGINYYSTNGWRGKLEKGGATRLAGAFANAQSVLTYLAFSNTWDAATAEANLPVYFLIKKDTNGKTFEQRSGYSKAGELFANANDLINAAGIVGSAFSDTTALLIASSPAVPRDDFNPKGLTNGLTNGQSVTCRAPASVIRGDIRYGRTGFTTETRESNAWGAPVTNEVDENGVYIYTHGASAGRVTWLYEEDGFRLLKETYPAAAGTATPDIAPAPDGFYAKGTNVTLTAQANENFQFDHWVVDREEKGSDPSITVAMDKGHTVRAVFESTLPPLVWAGGSGDVWTNGGAACWRFEDGTEMTNWVNGAVAVFTNAGDLDVAIAPGGVTASAVRFEGAGAVSINGETENRLTMSGEARISAEGAANVRINAPLAGDRGITIAHGTNAVFAGTLTESNQVVFPGTQLKDIGMIGARTCGQNITGDVPYVPCQDRTLADGGRDIQFQMYDAADGAKKTKFVRVLFTQNGNDVQARRISAGKLESAEGNLVGTDMEREEGVASGPFGITNITACAAAGRFIINTPTTFTGALTIEGGRIAFEQEGNLGGGTFGGAVVNNGVVVLPAGGQTFTGSISGTGRFLSIGTSESPATVTFKGASDWTGGLTLSNAVADVVNDNSLPKTGTLEAYAGGEFQFKEAAGHPNPVNLRPGGTLTFAAGGNKYEPWLNGIRKIFMEGGILNATSGDSTHCRNYVNWLDILNGGTINGNPCRVGNSPKSTWRVRGNKPCYQKAGFQLPQEYPNNFFTLDVGDTGFEGGDMFISGRIHGSKLNLLKTGPGTVVFQGTNTYSNCVTKIDGGTIRFETDSAMGAGTNTDTRIVLNGAEGKSCVLDIGTNANEVCALELQQKGGTLKLGGGTIAFADSHSLTWNTNALLTIDGALGAETVRFGTDKNGLSDGQIRQIKLKNNPGAALSLSTKGWLRINYGTVLILR